MAALLTVAALVPLAVLGHPAGRPVFARLAGAGRYERVLTGVLLCSVALGLSARSSRTGDPRAGRY